MAFHDVSFNSKPLEKLTHLSQTKTSLNEWTLVHVLSTKCGCSKKTARYLSQRGVLQKHKELVILIEENSKIKTILTTAGFQVISMTAEQAAKEYSIDAVPQLVVFGPMGDIKYSGGYNDRRIEVFEDLQVLNKLKKGQVVKAFPIFGCANGSELISQIDPWGLKYGERK